LALCYHLCGGLRVEVMYSRSCANLVILVPLWISLVDSKNL